MDEKEKKIWTDVARQADEDRHRGSTSASNHGLCCPVCGSKMAYIRGRSPGEEDRKVCPTCLQERMEEINEMSSRDYNVAYTG